MEFALRFIPLESDADVMLGKAIYADSGHIFRVDRIHREYFQDWQAVFVQLAEYTQGYVIDTCDAEPGTPMGNVLSREMSRHVGSVTELIFKDGYGYITQWIGGKLDLETNGEDEFYITLALHFGVQSMVEFDSLWANLGR